MTRVRSPAYPAISLPAAIEMTRKVHAAQQTTPEPRDVVLRHMGYASENGRSLKAISALIKYGFLEKAGDNGLRVSQQAISILFPDPDDLSAKDEALKEAARAPSLFAEIFDRWDARPSADSLNAFLIRKNFNTSALEQVARAFYETYDLVSGLGDSYTSEDAYDAPKEKEGQMQGCEPKEVRFNEEQTETPPVSYSLHNDTKPIFDFTTVKINTVIDNQEDLAELIARLEMVKGMLPRKTEH